MLEKKHIFLLGLIAFGVVIYINSNKKLEMQEVEEQIPSDKKSFNSSNLPLSLMPPIRLADGELVPKTSIKKNFTNVFNLKPRLDRKSNNFV